MADKHLQFLEFPRRIRTRSPWRRACVDFREIYSPYSAEAAAEQAGRCLACGNPFCEWKCPVHNYIPNWLALVNAGQAVRGRGALASDQLAAGSVRTHLSAGPAVRGRLHAE